MKKLSVILATFNEEKNIQACLASVKGLADEIVVVDGSSQDKTVALAKKAGAKVFVRPNPVMFHQNKQLAIQKATAEWILYLDADERVSEQLKREILEIIGHDVSPQRVPSATVRGETPNGYWIPRKNIIFGKWIKHTGWWPDKQLRLFKNGKAKLPCRSLHEQPELQGKAGELKNPLLHYNYQTISQFVNRLNIYSDNDKNVFLASAKEINWLDAVRWPAQEFLRRFFQQEGYKDGLHGLVLSLLQAFSSLVTFAKVWEAKKFSEATVNLDKLNKAKNSFTKEWHYWLLTSKIKKARGLTKLCNRLRRKLV